MINNIYSDRKIIVKNIDSNNLQDSYQIPPQFMPLQLGMPDEKGVIKWWLLPYEPLISISGSNIIKQRSVAKSIKRGTIKERWSEGDMKINIQGTFVNNNDIEYPTIEIQKLQDHITQRQPIYVQNELFVKLNIHRIVVVSYNYPFSKGENVQNWSIEAVSDDSFKLFTEVK